MSVDLGAILGDTADALGIGSSEGIAGIISKNVNLAVDKLKPGAPTTASNPPVVQPTQYVSSQQDKVPVLGFSLSAGQAKVAMFAGLGIIGLIAWKVLRKK